LNAAKQRNKAPAVSEDHEHQEDLNAQAQQKQSKYQATHMSDKAHKKDLNAQGRVKCGQT